MRHVYRTAFALIAAASIAAGQDEVRVRKPPTAKAALDTSGLKCGASPAAGLFRRTLDADLARSGWFVMAPPGGGAYVVLGNCDESGGNLNCLCQVFNGVTQQNRLNKSFAESAAEARKLAHKVADEIVLALTGFPGIASTRIVMVGKATGNKELYICDADGENVKQITHDRSISLGPSWDPRGGQIVYTSYRAGFPDVYLIDLNGGTRRAVATFPGMNMAGDISPDGRDLALVLSKDGNPDIYVMGLGGGRATRLTTTSPAAEVSPSWSPDGNQIVFASDRAGPGHPQLYVMSRSGGEARRLTTRGSENAAPDWGPGGKIAYCSKRGHYQICVLDVQKQEDQEITPGDADYEDPSWAPDGRHIACSRKAGGSSTIYLLDTMGDNPIALHRLGGDWFSPAWSPK